MGVPAEQAVSMDALSNPEAMQYFIAFAQQRTVAIKKRGEGEL
jgi:hypothetical protein